MSEELPSLPSLAKLSLRWPVEPDKPDESDGPDCAGKATKQFGDTCYFVTALSVAQVAFKETATNKAEITELEEKYWVAQNAAADARSDARRAESNKEPEAEAQAAVRLQKALKTITNLKEELDKGSETRPLHELMNLPADGRKLSWALRYPKAPELSDIVQPALLENYSLLWMADFTFYIPPGKYGKQELGLMWSFDGKDGKYRGGGTSEDLMNEATERLTPEHAARDLAYEVHRRRLRSRWYEEDDENDEEDEEDEEALYNERREALQKMIAKKQADIRRVMNSSSPNSDDERDRLQNELAELLKMVKEIDRLQEEIAELNKMAEESDGELVEEEEEEGEEAHYNEDGDLLDANGEPYNKPPADLTDGGRPDLMLLAMLVTMEVPFVVYHGTIPHAFHWKVEPFELPAKLPPQRRMPDRASEFDPNINLLLVEYLHRGTQGGRAFVIHHQLGPRYTLKAYLNNARGIPEAADGRRRNTIHKNLRMLGATASYHDPDINGRHAISIFPCGYAGDYKVCDSNAAKCYRGFDAWMKDQKISSTIEIDQMVIVWLRPGQ